jgi:hypothetical protein
MDGLIDDLERNPEFQVVQSFIPEAVLTSTLQLGSSRIGQLCQQRDIRLSRRILR